MEAMAATNSTTVKAGGIVGDVLCAQLLAGTAGGLQIPSMRQFKGRYKLAWLLLK
jgi:hypothetical protein